MELRQYMKLNSLTYTQLSDLSGVHRTALCRIALGKERVGRKRAKMIKKATGGVVTMHDLIKIDED